jgi:hypothetical protein
VYEFETEVVIGESEDEITNVLEQDDALRVTGLDVSKQSKRVIKE